MNCLCWKDSWQGARHLRLVCDRTDPHPDDFGADREGHHWIEATSEQWAAAREATRQAWAGQDDYPPLAYMFYSPEDLR
jgi:hypothetical protein